jgi:hypothetical protein
MEVFSEEPGGDRWPPFYLDGPSTTIRAAAERVGVVYEAANANPAEVVLLPRRR